MQQGQGGGLGLDEHVLAGPGLEAVVGQELGKSSFHGPRLTFTGPLSGVGYHKREMNDPQITPLARRLAEENGINWRSLAGSGPDGTIVERDILAYLAKVMAGEITLPPAP
ncbi:E3 binding domain-containing protein, partial [Calidithermus roseus]|uniref:E3 binding domain-containing protein n=1 Tax=Calidithermus roseus TaxID=1644118 RepID=UPI001FE971B6